MCMSALLICGRDPQEFRPIFLPDEDSLFTGPSGGAFSTVESGLFVSHYLRRRSLRSEKEAF
jgi:hypothetical protein